MIIPPYRDIIDLDKLEISLVLDKHNEQKMYELISEWLKDYHSAKDMHEKSKAKALIVSRMLPIVKRIARTR